MRAEPGPRLRSHIAADDSCGVWSIRLLRGRAESWDRQSTDCDFWISVFHNKPRHLQNNTQSTHTANNLSASYITKILDMSSEERWNNNHDLMQETKHITGWLHYSPKGVPFIFFHSFFFFFPKLEANGIAKALIPNNRIFTPKVKKNTSLCALFLNMLDGICDTWEKEIILSASQFWTWLPDER